jgi:hypothetical protein
MTGQEKSRLVDVLEHVEFITNSYEETALCPSCGASAPDVKTGQARGVMGYKYGVPDGGHYADCRLAAELALARNVVNDDCTRCILTGMADEPKQTWCGRKSDPFEWCFVDATHAALNARQQQWLLSCRKCAEAVAKVLLGHTGKL